MAKEPPIELPTQLSANSAALSKTEQKTPTKLILIYAVDALLLILVLVVLTYDLVPKSAPTRTVSPKTSNTAKPVQNSYSNPINNNPNDINSDVQFCSNIVAAESEC